MAAVDDNNICGYCGGTLQHIAVGLSKCLICGSYLRSSTQSYTLKVFPRVDILRDRANETVSSSPEPDIDAQEYIWVSRVAEALAPTTGLDGDARERCLKVQETFRGELVNVLRGKEDFSKWYDRTKTGLGLHNYTFMKKLYDCFEGLKGEELEKLRQSYQQALMNMPHV